MNWKQLSLASMLSLALATGAAGTPARSALAANDPAPTPTIITAMDVSLAASVQATLAGDQDLSYDNIAVSAKDGWVVLLGSVRSESERSRAIQDAKSVPGVTKVDDNLSVNEATY
jgi:osmotically-inducible protein OsmY